MTPELKLQFQQKIYELHINSSMGVDEKNIEKIRNICFQLYDLSEKLYSLTHSDNRTKDDVLVFEKEENDVVEATQELRTKARPHKPEAK